MGIPASGDLAGFVDFGFPDWSEEYSDGYFPEGGCSRRPRSSPKRRSFQPLILHPVTNCPFIFPVAIDATICKMLRSIVILQYILALWISSIVDNTVNNGRKML